MPPLARPSKHETVAFGSTQVPLLADTDVLVVGGGMAGIGAAIGAASAGASVVLVERYGFLGGSGTAALAMPFASYYTNKPATCPVPEKPTLFPTDHCEGEPIIAGVFARLLERLIAEGGAVPPSPRTGFTVPFDPEVFKIVALHLLDEANVNILFHALASDILESNGVAGVLFQTKSGLIAITADVLIDCTGDADISALAGAAYEMGRGGDQIPQPMSLLFKMGGFNYADFDAYVKQHPDQWRGVLGLWELVEQARRDGKLDLKRENILLFGTVREDEVIVNSTRITNVIGTDVIDLTRAEWEGRHQVEQVARFLKHYVPGFKNAYISQSGTMVGVRETRRVVGKYMLTAEDIISARKFDDVIARGTYPIDIHNPAGKGTLLQQIPQNEAYDIPLRCLLPEKVRNLLVAGRCISGTHEAQASFRIMPICMATGQAAGVCAALALNKKIPPDAVPFREVQAELLRQGANLRGIKPKAV